MIRVQQAKFLTILTFTLVFITIFLPFSEGQGGEKVRWLYSFISRGMDLPLKQPVDLFLDREHGEVYVTSLENNSVHVFDTEGNPLFAFWDEKMLRRSLSAVVTREGNILVARKGDEKVSVFNMRGDFVGYLPLQGPPEKKMKPTHLTLDERGNLYVIDDYRKVLVFDAQGKFLFRIAPRPASEMAGVSKVSLRDLTLDRGGRIYVLDSEASKVLVYSPRGDLLLSFGKKGGGRGKLSYPSSVTVDHRGRILVADKHRHTILVFSPEGEFLFEFAGLGRLDGWLYFPLSLVADDKGRLYISDTLDRVQVFQLSSSEK